MESIKKLGKVLIGALIVIAGFASCEKSDLKPEGPVAELNESTPIVAPTTWRVKSFQWKNKAENGNFKYYVFRFNVDGSITAIHNNITEYGKWRKRGNILRIDFNQGLLSELNCAWTIVEHTRNKLVLKGLSPYDYSSQMLELEKVNDTEPL